MKKTTLIFLTTFFFFVGITTTKAYGEEVSPMIDISSWNITFEEKTWTDEQENMMLNWVNNNCSSYEHYIITSPTGWFYSSINESIANIYCFNGDFDNIGLNISKYSSTYYLGLAIEPYNSSNKVSIKRGHILTGSNSVVEDSNQSTAPRLWSNYKKHTDEIIIPYIISSFPGITFVSPSNNKPWSSSVSQKSIKYNDTIYNVGDIIFENGSFKNPIPDLIDYDYSYKENRQLFSLDFYFVPDDLSLNKNYEIDITNLDLNQELFDLDGFKYYGLINEDGLYHWEDIHKNNSSDSHSNGVIDYEIVYKCTNNDIVDNCGFKLVLKDFGIDFINEKYEKIRFSITFKNVFKYNLKISSPYELTKDNFYYNIIGLEKFVIKNNTKDFPYLIFSTKKDSFTSSIYTDYDNDNHILYSSYFNTNSGYSTDTILDFNSQYTEMIDTIPINIGLSNKQGLWISSDHDDFFDYYIYYNGLDIYYSFNSNKDLNDSIYIDDTGTQVILPLIPQEGDIYNNSDIIASFKRVFKKFAKIITYIFENIRTFFYELPGMFQDYYILIFGFIIFLIAIRFIL